MLSVLFLFIAQFESLFHLYNLIFVQVFFHIHIKVWFLAENFIQSCPVLSVKQMSSFAHLSKLFNPYLVSKFLSSKNFAICKIILFLVCSLLLLPFSILFGPAITTAQTSSRAAAVRTKWFLCEGPFEHRVLTAWNVFICVTIQSRERLASCLMNLFASAVLNKSKLTMSSNSWNF